MKSAFKMATLAAVLALAACGGGGGDESPAYLAGTYSTKMTKTSDNCRIGSSYSTVQHVVTVDGDTVTMQANSLTLKGGASADGLHATFMR